MPTGVALRDVRDQLFLAAERILLRDGPAALTSRAVTTEAGVAKGVLHKYFPDFDAFLVDLVREHQARWEARSGDLWLTAGTGTVEDNLGEVLAELFGPVGAAMVTLLITRDEMRRRLRPPGQTGMPLLADAVRMINGYLTLERDWHRITVEADLGTLSLTLVGAAHLLFTGRDGHPPDPIEVRRVVTSVLGPALIG